ncbi:MAG: aspartate aminotransferase family protein, partial [Dehalococcoidia bacterium]
RAEGIYLYGPDGKRYIDGLSALWNVAVGHGRRELAAAAAEQLSKGAFTSNYVGFSNEPAIELAAKVVELAPHNMQSAYFTNSGSESNETNFKAARFYWAMKGRPEKNKIISRVEAYHGNTLAAMSATGMAVYYPNFGPRVAEIIPAASVEPKLSGGGRIDPGNVDISNIVETIEQEGAETVAAVIAEPVQGAGGIHPPPPDYIRQLREVCDRYDLLFIVDEVITGFGRTGKWFAMEHFNVLPDMISLAKAITSAYIPMGAALWSREVWETITGTDASVKFMHAYTNSGHNGAAAVGLRNLQIFEDEKLVQNAAERGAQLRAGLDRLAEHPHVGNVRGLGFMCAFDLLQDPDNDVPFDASAKMGPRLLGACRERGLISRIRVDSYLLAPPLVTTKAQVDDILTILEESVREVTAGV